MDEMGLPMSFGKVAKVKKVNVEAKLAETKRPVAAIGPENALPKAQSSDAAGTSAVMPPPAEVPSKRKAEEIEDAEDNEDGVESDADENPDYDEEPDRLPVSHEIIMKDHTKATTCIAIDGAGARVATGSHDYDVKLWDFAGMDARLKPFKTFEPAESYHVHDLSFSLDGKKLLVISGTTQPKVYDRDGENDVSYNKGDPYLRDMNHTKGHIAELTAGSWHPTDPKLFLTSANDSTIRIWDTETRMKQKQVIVIKSKDRGARTRVTACAWSSDGSQIAGACSDGSLHIWNTKSNFVRAAQQNDAAHTKGSDITSVVFSRDGRHLATRGGDDTVKLWETRSLRKPVATATGLGNIYAETNLIFSPDDQTLLTGTAVKKGSEDFGEIVCLARENLEVERRIPIAKGSSVVKVIWHSKINQILASTSTGAIHVLYSPRSSIRGALLPLQKMPKSAPRDLSFSTATGVPVIMTPHALPMFADEDYTAEKRKRNRESKLRKPMEPVYGAGKNGRIGSSATQPMVAHLFRNGVPKDEDPREALLRYATDEQKDKARKQAEAQQARD